MGVERFKNYSTDAKAPLLPGKLIMDWGIAKLAR
jgi:hypothetical protein